MSECGEVPLPGGTPPPGETARLLDVLTRIVVDGDAASEDIITILGGDPDESRRRLRRLSQYSSAQDVPSIEHRVPHVPFILNGTLYDPADIRRFDGQALHFVRSANGEYMLAVVDLTTMLLWWQAARYQYGGYQFGPGPEEPNKGGGQITPTTHTTFPPEASATPLRNIFAHAYEDMDFGGDYLTLENPSISIATSPDHYSNLLWVSHGFLGLGDWNDIISSVSVGIEHTCVLFEHIQFGILDGGTR